MSTDQIIKTPNFKREKGVYKIYCFLNIKNDEVRFINLTQRRIYDEYQAYWRSAMDNRVPIINKTLHEWWHDVRRETGDHLFIKQLAEATSREEAVRLIGQISQAYRNSGCKLIDNSTDAPAKRERVPFQYMTKDEKIHYIRMSRDILQIFLDAGKEGIHRTKALQISPKIYDADDSKLMIKRLEEDGLIKERRKMKNGRAHLGLVHKDFW